MITKSEQITNLAAALLKAQRAIGFAVKGAKNPFFKSTYADLGAVIEAIKGPLNDNGITFLQAVDSDPGDSAAVDTILLHESGQFISCRTPVFCAKPNDPQAFGSGLTYSKRYALQALLGIPTADDDGEGAMGRKGKKTTTPKKSTPAEVVAETYQQYIKDHANDITEYFRLPIEVFTTMMRDEVTKQLKDKTPEQRKAIPYTVELLLPWAEEAITPKLAKLLVDVEVK